MPATWRALPRRRVDSFACFGTTHELMRCDDGPTQEGHMTTQSILFFTLVILGFGSFTAALAWTEYCGIHLDNRLGWRHLVK